MKFKFFLLLLIYCNISFCQPVITGFLPHSGPTGTQVLIKGINFNTIAANNIVYFGATKGTIISASLDSIKVLVPTGATHNLITVTNNNLTAYSATKFLPVGGTGDSLTTGSFAAKQDYTSGNYPFDVAIADFDGDGKCDVVTNNSGTANIQVFKNISSVDIDVTPQGNYATSAQPGDIKTGDIDGDGKPDIVTANDISKTLSVFINTTTGSTITFAQKQDFPTGTYAVAVAMGDIDGDGKVDLIELNNSDNTVSVLRNTGTPGALSFAAKIDFPTGEAPSHVAVMDLDQDGKQDIILTNQYDSSISILKNTSAPGTISFQDKVDFYTGHSMSRIDIGDLNNDNKPDIVTGNVDSTISILTNTSTAQGFNFTVQHIVIGAVPKNVAIGDLNGDGKPDLAISGGEVNVTVLQNTSIGNNVGFGNNFKIYAAGGSDDIKIADINNDGRADILLGQGNHLSILRNKMPAPLSICPNGSATISSNVLLGPFFQWQANFGSGFVNITDNGNYSGTNTATLQLTSIPSTWYRVKFRCYYQAFVSYSDETFLKFEDSWTGSSGSNWENPLNWSCGNVPDANTDVIINSGTVVINSNVTIRSLQINPGVQLTVLPGFTLTILH